MANMNCVLGSTGEVSLRRSALDELRATFWHLLGSPPCPKVRAKDCLLAFIFVQKEVVKALIQLVPLSLKFSGPSTPPSHAHNPLFTHPLSLLTLGPPFPHSQLPSRTHGASEGRGNQLHKCRGEYGNG